MEQSKNDSKIGNILFSVTKRNSDEANSNINEIVLNKLSSKLKDQKIPGKLSNPYVKENKCNNLLDLHKAVSAEKTIIINAKSTDEDKKRNEFFKAVNDYVKETYVNGDKGIMMTERINTNSASKNGKNGLTQENFERIQEFFHVDDMAILSAYINRKDKTAIDNKLADSMKEVLKNDTHFKSMPKDVSNFIESVLSGSGNYGKCKSIDDFTGKYNRKSMTLNEYKNYASKHSTRTGASCVGELKKITNAYVSEHLRLAKENYVTGRREVKGAKKKLVVDMLFNDEYANSWVYNFDRNMESFKKTQEYLSSNSNAEEKPKLELNDSSIIKPVITEAISKVQDDINEIFAKPNAEGRMVGGCTISQGFRSYMTSVTNDFVINLVSASIVNAEYNGNNTLSGEIIRGTFHSSMRMFGAGDVAKEITA